MCDVKPRLGASLEGNPETEGLMKSDAEIRDDVIDELRWHPQMPEPDATGVAVTDGAVTLTGHPVDAHHSGRRQGPPAHLLAQPAR
jgi:hypothetical protein